KGVPHQPVVKYVVTNKGARKHVTPLFEPRDGHTGGPAMPRQVEIKPGIIAERLADRLPLAAIARKSMQKDQPGVTWLTGLLRACEDHRWLTCASRLCSFCAPSASLTTSSISVAPGCRQALLRAASSASQFSGRWYFRLNIAA